MNVFYLNKNPLECAQEHCDKHVVKMIIEYAQLMSTAHRVLDGELYEDRTANNRRIKRWRLPMKHYEDLYYKASHINHPSAIWARQSSGNYRWLYSMWYQLCLEYTHRYGKTHETFRKLSAALCHLPLNIAHENFSEPPPAMPDHCKLPSPIESYRNYYIKEKAKFAKWSKRDTPEWFNNAFL